MAQFACVCIRGADVAAGHTLGLTAVGKYWVIWNAIGLFFVDEVLSFFQVPAEVLGFVEQVWRQFAH